MQVIWAKLLALLGLLALACAPAAAQGSFPSRQVHIYIPYPAGGAVDIIGRTLGDELGKTWGQSVVIENRPGAGGTIATRALATAPPDGYTLIVVASGHATNPFIYSKLPYDTLKDFTSVALIGTSPNIVLVPAGSPFKTLGDLLAEARQKPGSLSYGMAGAGTSTHLAGELLKHLAKVDIATVAYRGGAPAINDLIGGHIPISINNAPESLPQITAGTVRALGVTTAQRSPFLPDVPTIAEGGVPGYDTAVWWAVLGPAGMSSDLVARLSRDFAEVLKASAVKERLASQGATITAGSPQELDQLIRSEYEKWGPVIKAAGIKAE
jgi:tripartite-type tricarboxylate transporter receptor subunit TctC